MNEIKIFENKDFDKVKEIRNDKGDYLGYVYALECGEFVKIGCTKRPYQRLRYLINSIENYGRMDIKRFALTKAHSNYYRNERRMHEYFKMYRVDETELFELKFKKAVKAMSEILEFKNESIESKYKADWIIEFITTLKNRIMIEDKKIFNKMNDEDIDKAIHMLEKYKTMRGEIKMFFSEFLE
ncbi:MAG: GIY-YIG nuclease family protein [Ruminococcus flavefaciens]|nr:GIY-YIG nuclease family protein [Ruminococcus flavefaciens]